MKKRNSYYLEKPWHKALPDSPLEAHLIGQLIKRIRSKSIYGTTKEISDYTKLRHLTVLKVLKEYATEENGYTSWRPAKKHKRYRPIKPTFGKNCAVYWS